MDAIKAWRYALALACCLLPVGIASADGLIRDGIGAISTGRGGTNLGFADNVAIIHDNPAAMVNIAGSKMFEIGVDTLFTDLHYTDPLNANVNSANRPLPIPQAGFIHKDPTGEFAWGLGIFAPAGFAASYQMDHAIFGRSGYRSYGNLVKVLPGVAWRMTDRLSIGGTFGVAFSQVELTGPYTLQSGALAGAPTMMDLDVDGFAPVGSVGIQYQLTPRTTLGATYMTESSFRLTGNASATVVQPGPTFVESDFDARLRKTWPQSVALGLMHDITCCHRVAVEGIWFDWSGAFRDLDMRLSNPSNQGFDPVTPHDERLPLRWRDSVSLRFGYEWDVTCCDTLRFGYVYHRVPVPDETLNPYIDGVLEHAFSIGWSRATHRGIWSLAYQYSFGGRRHIGDSDIIGGDFDDSTFKAQAHWAGISLMVPF